MLKLVVWWKKIHVLQLVEKDSRAASFAISATEPVRPVPHGPDIEDLV